MKVEINEVAVESEKKYPCLMVSDSGCVVLFTGYRTGTIVALKTELKNDPVGRHSISWGMDAFKPYHGSVTLSSGE